MSHLADLIAEGPGEHRTYDLSQPLTNGMTCGERHPGFRMGMLARHGDSVRSDGVSAAYEVIVMGGHVGTHLDALCHISHEGRMFGDVDALEAQRGGTFDAGGIEEFPLRIRRGVLLDVAAHHGVSALAPGYAVTAEDLVATASDGGVRVVPGDSILVRTGYGALFGEAERYLGTGPAEGGVPGIAEDAALWIAEQGAALSGIDTSPFDVVPDRRGPLELPAHRVLLTERGINILENLNLERLAADGVREFLLLVLPLLIPGATGSPVRPVAVVGSD